MSKYYCYTGFVKAMGHVAVNLVCSRNIYVSYYNGNIEQVPQAMTVELMQEAAELSTLVFYS